MPEDYISMIKKLDKLILKTFIGPFLATFFIAFFVLMMQSLWKYVDDLVGKGLDFITICQFLWYASASMLMLAMPIAILISSIMTFGNLGESFELVAIKSSGISLLRFMRPLIGVSIILCSLTFVFANYVIPYANLKFITLYSEIYTKKPAFDLKEGVFFTYIPNYAIKVGKKDPDGKTIHNVVIFEQNNDIQDNCIVAEKGVMKISDDENFLEFNLENGYRYEEKGRNNDTANEFIRVGFKNFKKLFDLSILQSQKTNDSIYRSNYRMLSSRQLGRSVDSLKKLEKGLDQSLHTQLQYELNYTGLTPEKYLKKISDSGYNYNTFIPDSVNNRVRQISVEKAVALKNILQQNSSEKDSRQREIRLHLMEWHRKFSLSLACLVLFFIGAPLGSIIRKGGLGIPLVLAIIFFLIFHLMMMFGEKFIKEGVMSAFVGMWLTNFVYIPLGCFLVYKAMNDSQLFNKEFYVRVFNKGAHLLRLKK
jgi:lipopolysaccharide export system permease protein